MSLGWWEPSWLPAAGEEGTRALLVGVGVLPFLAVIIFGFTLL